MRRPAAAPLLACLAAAIALSAQAQRAEPVRRVGFLGMDSAMQARRAEAYREEMRRLGFVEGRNLHIEYRWAEGRFDRLPALATELVDANVEVIVTAAPPAVNAVRKATRTIPIVMSVHDPQAIGIVANLSRPGGNVTGVAFPDGELSTKRLDLLRNLVPGLSRVAVIWHASGGGPYTLQQVEKAAAEMKLTTRAFEVREPADLASAVAAAKAWGAQGVVQMAAPFITKHRKVLIEALGAQQMPAACELREYVYDGCLLTYSADLNALFGQMAPITVRILKGAKPADLPIAQPTKFDLVINMKTAAALGLAVPSAVMMQTTARVE
jgi:putative ABC transport system substrate-binding protein